MLRVRSTLLSMELCSNKAWKLFAILHYKNALETSIVHAKNSPDLVKAKRNGYLLINGFKHRIMLYFRIYFGKHCRQFGQYLPDMVFDEFVAENYSAVLIPFRVQ